jgi:hypothetical protein
VPQARVLEDAVDLLIRLRTAGVRLEARGDRLVVEGPTTVLTKEVREALAAAKPDLLRLLDTESRFVTLRGGLTLPVEPLELALRLEAEGFNLRLDGDDGELIVEPADSLTAEDRAAIARWQRHLAVILRYCNEPPM